MAEANTNPADNNKKWWLIGCGGCLVIVVVLVVAVMALGGWGFNYAKQASEGTTKELLGESYTPPANYMVIGLPWGQKDLKSVILMIDAQRGTMILLIDTIIPPDASKILKQGNPKQISDFIKQVSSQASSGPGQKAHVDVSDLRIEQVHPIKLKNGKTVAFCHARTFDKNKGTYGPAVVALLPQEKQDLVVVMGLDPRNTSTDPKADFETAYNNLESELYMLISDSELDDRLQ